MSDDMKAPGSEPAPSADEKPENECKHENFHVNATGISHNADGTVTIRTHYWCDECQTGFHHDQTIPAAEYWQLVREGDLD